MYQNSFSKMSMRKKTVIWYLGVLSFTVILFFILKSVGAEVQDLRRLLIVAPFGIWCAWKEYKINEIFKVWAVFFLTCLIAGSVAESSNVKEVFGFVMGTSIFFPVSVFVFDLLLAPLFVLLRKKLPKKDFYE